MNPVEIISKTKPSVKTVSEVSTVNHYAYMGANPADGYFTIGIVCHDYHAGWSAPHLYSQAPVSKTDFFPSLKQKIQDLLDKKFRVFEFQNATERARWLVKQIANAE